jgi:hypothetical protein
MNKIDPEQERRRLAHFYAGQMDGELEKVAAQAYELTDLAREALREELARRGLPPNFIEQRPAIVKKEPPPMPGDPPPVDPPFEPPPVEMPPDNEIEFQKLVTIRVFRDLPQALLAKGCLESAGIDCMFADDNLVRLDWFYSNAVGGIKLLVEGRDAAEAEQVLSQPIPEHLDVAGVGDYEQPKCPKCGSLDVNFRELDPATYLSLGGSYWGLFVPIPIHRRAWSCHSCDAEWEDDGVHDDGAPGSAEPNV